MISKCVNKILFGLVAVSLLLGINVINSFAQQTAPTGKTIEQASQLVLWYDNDQEYNNRYSFIQVTNADRFSNICLHFQVFKSYPNDSTITKCEEVDFVDCYTPLDTHNYDMSDNSLELNDGGTVSVGADETKGFVVVTPIAATPDNKNADYTAISFQHMFGSSTIFDDDAEYMYRVPSMGRDAKDNAPGGGIAADFTELDGVTAGYVLLQPDVLKFNFASLQEWNLADVVSIAFSDDYAGFLGGYDADPAAATLAVNIFDDDEDDISCGNQTQDCFFDIGINDNYYPANPLLDPPDHDRRLCPGTTTVDGWARLGVTLAGDSAFENEMGLVGIIMPGGVDVAMAQTAQLQFLSTVGGADWMHAE
jgi:hypothetical protein